MNEITVSNVNAISEFHFKNETLNRYSRDISVVMADAAALYADTRERIAAINTALAPLFGKVLETKCYADDGFKSVADYAEQTFGIGKASAYALANVGKKFFNTNSALAKEAREAFTTAKLAELKNVELPEIAKGMESGEISSETTLADLREWAGKHKKGADAVKVVPKFDVRDKGCSTPIAENVTKDEMYAEVAAALVGRGRAKDIADVQFIGIKLEGDKPANKQHFIAYAPTGYTGMYTYEPHVKAKEPKRKSKESFDLNAYLASLAPEDRAAFFVKVAEMRDDPAEDVED